MPQQPDAVSRLVAADTPQSQQTVGNPMIAERRISVAGIGTSYYEKGTGHPILCLHGASPGMIWDARLSWIRQLHGLSDQFRVIALDQLQFGGTDNPAPPGQYINRLGRVDHVIGFIEAMGLKGITLVGNSEGSFVAARVAIVRPDLVFRLVLLTGNSSSPPFGDERDKTWMDANEKEYYSDLGKPMPTEEGFIREGDAAGGHDPFEAELKEYRRIAYRRPQTRERWKILKNAPEEETNTRLYVTLQQRYIIPYLDRLQPQTLIIWSKDDPIVPPDNGFRLAKLIRNSEFHLLRGGHGLHHQQSDAVNRLIRYWHG